MTKYLIFKLFFTYFGTITFINVWIKLCVYIVTYILIYLSYIIFFYVWFFLKCENMTLKGEPTLSWQAKQVIAVNFWQRQHPVLSALVSPF